MSPSLRVSWRLATGGGRLMGTADERRAAPVACRQSPAASRQSRPVGKTKGQLSTPVEPADCAAIPPAHVFAHMVGVHRSRRYTVPATTCVRKSGVSHHNAPTIGERLEAHMTTAGCHALAALLACA